LAEATRACPGPGRAYGRLR